MSEGGSAGKRAQELRAEAAAARARAESLEREAGAWEAGAEGERRVGTQLNALPVGWHVLHDRLLRPGRSASNLDHVVVGPAGIFLIDSKTWAGRLTLYEGTLWQHNGGHQSRRSDLEQVARAAAQMESVLGVPVTPLIALAGRAGNDLDPCRVQGVEVVPAGRLGTWLIGQPGSGNALELEAVARRVAVSFPPASPESAPAHMAGRPVPESGLPPRRKRSSPRRVASRRRQRGAMWKFVIALALFAVAPSFLPWVAGKAGQMVETSLRPGGSVATTASTCSLVDRHVTALLGGQMKADTRVTGQCRWSTTSLPARITDVTVNFATRLTGAGAATAQGGVAGVLVPAGQGIPDWGTSKITTPQAFSIRLRYGYPEKATKTQRKEADASALSDAVALAKALAEALTRASGPPSEWVG